MAVATDARPRPSFTQALTASRPSHRHSLVGRLSRCMGVSVVTTIVSVTTLTLGIAVVGMAAWMANITATSVATVPSYHLNRRWTWGKTDASNLWREVLPFWVLSFLGLVLSTIAVALTAAWTDGMHFPSPAMHTGVILAAHLSGFGALWIVQFVLLDRVLFVERI
jgi:putative flippase GtrA